MSRTCRRKSSQRASSDGSWVSVSRGGPLACSSSSCSTEHASAGAATAASGTRSGASSPHGEHGCGLSSAGTGAGAGSGGSSQAAEALPGDVAQPPAAELATPHVPPPAPEPASAGASEASAEDGRGCSRDVDGVGKAEAEAEGAGEGGNEGASSERRARRACRVASSSRSEARHLLSNSSVRHCAMDSSCSRSRERRRSAPSGAWPLPTAPPPGPSRASRGGALWRSSSSWYAASARSFWW
mmetsp:Transcript_38697/g.109414  ORF Transcript_38697/g.109414 Transcript_38697/m.109414 type:complete len:242 (-) Transcript_38697:305-1030(-)